MKHSMKDIESAVILITGSTDGLGKQVAYKLAKRGATILLHGRNLDKGKSVLQKIQKETHNEKLKYYNADFSSLVAVRQFAKEVQEDWNQLDVLINNAGLGERGGAPREESKDGYELLFAVNYLAPYLLTHSLQPLLLQSSPSRIVNVASAGQRALNFDDIMLEKVEYNGFNAYMQSKLALIMFTFDLAEELKNTTVTANTLHPATHMNTKMVREATGLTSRNTLQNGIEAVEYLATASELDNVTGKYFNGKEQAQANDQAYKDMARQQLRELSEQLTNPDLKE